MPHSNLQPRFISGILYGLLIFCSLPSIAQPDDIRFNRIGAKEGLSDYMVHNIYEDRHGFMWFDNFRYDGRKIKFYPQGSSTAVQVGDLLADNWDGKPDSLYYYDPLRDEFIDNLPPDIKPLLYHYSPSFGSATCTRCFAQDARQDIWFRTLNKGVFVYRRSTKSFKNFRHLTEDTSSLSSNRISALLKDQQD